MRNVLIVYAHQEPKSFNGALRDITVNTLKSQGHRVEVSDLYEMRFDPTASKHHFKGRFSLLSLISASACLSINLSIHI